MPEGPSIVILREACESFVGKKVIEASGNASTIDYHRIEGKKIISIKSWGKHLLISFKDFSLRIHLLMFGSYTINDSKDKPARLALAFPKNQELNFYTCSVKMIEQPLDEVYDWEADVMNENWSAAKAVAKLKAKPDMLVCDALLDQSIFSGVGNIIKNEVLFITRIHPESTVGKLSPAKRKALINETVKYSFQFLTWKKEFTLKKHWQAHTKKICPRDNVPFIKKYLGKTKRRTFYCEVCQQLYN